MEVASDDSKSTNPVCLWRSVFVQASTSRVWEAIARSDTPVWNAILLDIKGDNDNSHETERISASDAEIRDADSASQDSGANSFAGKFTSYIIHPTNLLSLIYNDDGKGIRELGASHIRHHSRN